MRVHIPDGRRLRRRSSLVAVVATMVALLAAPMSASAAELNEHSTPPTDSFGWYNDPSVTVQLLATVRDGVSAKGAYEEFLKSVDCTGTGVSGGMPFNGTYRGSDTVVYVTIQGPTGPTGLQFVCTATFLRTYPTTCVIVFGVEICDPPRQDPDEVTDVYVDTVRLDHTPPAVGAFPDQLATAGWYRTATTVDFRGIDHDSGIRQCDEDVPISTISSASVRTLTGRCMNGAGLFGIQFFSYQFDDVPPSLAPSVSPAEILVGDSASASANATDQHSGVESQECDPLDTATPGLHTVECRASDNAGNTASATLSYSVAYGFSGFAQPVDANARNVAKAGRTIPLKWRVTDAAGAPITGLTSVGVTAASLSCSVGATGDAIEEYASGSSGLQDLGDGYYQFNWATPMSYANSCKTLRLDLGDGIARTATFEFTK